MPAVTVDDVLTLPPIAKPDPATTTPRPVVSITTAPHGYEGLGFPVRRAFAGVDLAQLDPRSEEHTSELQSRENLVCRLRLEKKKTDWRCQRKSNECKYAKRHEI